MKCPKCKRVPNVRENTVVCEDGRSFEVSCCGVTTGTVKVADFRYSRNVHDALEPLRKAWDEATLKAYPPPEPVVDESLPY